MYGQMSAGSYTLKFEVLDGEDVEVGAGQVTVSVHPPAVEVPPVPIIRPQQHLLVSCLFLLSRVAANYSSLFVHV